MADNDPVLRKDIKQIIQLPPTPGGANPTGSQIAIWNPSTARAERVDPRIIVGGFLGAIKTDSDVNPAIPFVYYLIDGNSGPRVVTLPDPMTGCEDEFSVTLELDTHKVTITTESGTALIGGATSQVIPNIGGLVQVICNGIDGYDIILDTRAMQDEVIITTDRDFSDGDGFEANVNYKCVTDVAILLTFPLPKTFANNKNISSLFILEGAGSVTMSVIGGGADIGNAASQVISTDGKSIQIIEGGGEYLVGQDSRQSIPLSSIIMYFLTEASTIPTYLRLTTSRTDPDYGAEAFADFTTASTSFIFLVARATDEVGADLNVPDTTMIVSTIIEKLSGNDAEVYYELYKRDAGGTETMLGESPAAILSVLAKLEVNLFISLAPFSMVPTDRFVIKSYGRKIGTGQDPIIRVYYEGDTPSKAILSVPSSEVPHGSLQGRDALDSHPSGAISHDDTISQLGVDNVKAAIDALATAGDASTKATAQETIIEGDPLYLSGWDTGNSRHEVSKADSAISTKMPCTHTAVSAGAATEEITISSIADTQNLNTSGTIVNDPVYVAAGGGWTNVKPPINPQVIGNISRVNATLGSISFNVDATIISDTDVIIPSDNIIPDGNFNDPLEWTASAAWVVANSKATFTTGGSSGQLCVPEVDLTKPTKGNTEHTIVFYVDIPSGNAEIAFFNEDLSRSYISKTSYAKGQHTVKYTTAGEPGDGGVCIRGYSDSENDFYLPYIYWSTKAEAKPLLQWIFDDSTVDSNPQGQRFRFSGAKDFMYISDDRYQNDAPLDGFLQVTNQGAAMYLECDSNVQKYFSIQVTGATIDATGYTKIPISVTGSDVPLVEGDVVGFTINNAGAAAVLALTANSTFTKTAAKSWEDIYDEITAAKITNVGGWIVDVVLEGTNATTGKVIHDVDAYNFTDRGWHNGVLRLRAATAIIGDYGIDQCAAINFNSTGGFEFNGNVDIQILNLEIHVPSGGNTAPFGVASNNTITTQKCWFNPSLAGADISIFTFGGGKLISNHDTFSGINGQIANFVEFGNGAANMLGGDVHVFNAHASGSYLFTNAVSGVGVVAMDTVSNAAFTNKIANGAVDLTAV